MYDVGSTFAPRNSSSCMQCSCKSKEEGGVYCEDKSQTCDLTCEGELERVEGECCPRCKPACAVKAVPQKIVVGNCVSDSDIDMGSCSGTCPSSASAMARAPFLTADCKCCKPASIRKMTVTLNCEDGSTIQHSMIAIESCACEACEYNPFGSQPAEEILGLTAS